MPGPSDYSIFGILSSASLAGNALSDIARIFQLLIGLIAVMLLVSAVICISALAFQTLVRYATDFDWEAERRQQAHNAAQLLRRNNELHRQQYRQYLKNCTFEGSKQLFRTLPTPNSYEQQQVYRRLVGLLRQIDLGNNTLEVPPYNDPDPERYYYWIEHEALRGLNPKTARKQFVELMKKTYPHFYQEP